MQKEVVGGGGYLFAVDTVDVVHFLQTSPVCRGESLENKQSISRQHSSVLL